MVWREEDDLGIELRKHALQLVLVLDLDHAFEADRTCLAVALDKRVFALAGHEQPSVGAGRAGFRGRAPAHSDRQDVIRRHSARRDEQADGVTRDRGRGCCVGAYLDEDRDPISLGDRLAQATPVGHARRS